MTPRVSVVVPVYDPGPYLDPLVDSLLRQTLPPEEFEAVFVDDGSTDDTPARLDALAARHPHFRVVHIPNSGWPGRPRNVGVDHARGAYVQFVDNDDWLGPEALQRLCDYAEEHGSDIVVGKEVRQPGEPVHFGLFNRNRPHARLGVDPLLSPLTPHKMFRREFLLGHGLRFPEGRRRLEDHLFVTRAYFLADVISVLADYPCYYWRRREGNAGSARRDWREWYGYLEETLDVVEEHTGPGELRDTLLAHWYVDKVLRLAAHAGKPHEGRAREFFDAASDLVVRRFPPRLDRHAAGMAAAHAALLRAGDFEGLRRLVRWERRLGVEATLAADPVPGPGGTWLLEVRATLVDGGAPLRLRHRDGRPVLALPAGVPEVPAGAVDAATLPGAVALTVQPRGSGEVHVVRGRVALDAGDGAAEPPCTLAGRFRLDPSTLAGGAPLPPGPHALGLRVGHLGPRRNLRAPLRPAPGVRVDRARETDAAVRVHATPDGELELRVPEGGRSGGA